MSFLQGIFGSLGSIFADPDSGQRWNSTQNPNSSTMEGASVVSERVAYKLKGYFDLAKEEIAKAVRAEELGLTNDAILHYRNAQRILGEGASTTAPSYITPSEKEKVNSYQQKIAKWQAQVAERLQALSQQTGGKIRDKITRSHPQAAQLTQKPTNWSKNVLLREPSFSGNSAGPRAQRGTTGASNSNQDNIGDDTKLVQMINSVIVDRSPSVKWDDIAGLENAKQTLFEMVILPTKRRDLFTGLRRPPRGLLLFGPPGNGKTMLAKAVASESDATFFNVSASSLTSKWVGEGEKLVRTLFMVAISRQPSVIFMDEGKNQSFPRLLVQGPMLVATRVFTLGRSTVRTLFMVAISRQPSVIFMDEIDSIMSTRLTNEHDASRRLKSEFLVQFDGVTSNPDDLVIVIGATNKPQELDDAVLRRLVKRIYIPLPDQSVRSLILKQSLRGRAFSLPGRDLERLARETEGYSGSDLRALCEEAAMMPIRELGRYILTVKADQVRSLTYDDFRRAMAVIRPSLQKSKWKELEHWNEGFGSN